VSSRNDPTLAKGRVAGAIAGVLVLFAPASVRAEDVEEPIVLHYAAGDLCPSEEDFIALVRAQTPRWTRVPEGVPSRRTMRVVLSTRANGADGKLVVATPKGGVSERAIEGPTCMAVSRALALMVAVAIDPRAGEAGPTTEAPAEPEALEATPPSAEERSNVAAPERAPARPALFRKNGVPPSDAPARAWPRVSLELRAEATSAVVRGALFGGALTAKVELPPDAGPALLRAWQPSLGLGIRQSLPKERSLRGGSAEFTWTAAHLHLCPFRVTLRQRVALAPCAEANAGQLDVAARGFGAARSVSTFWLDVGASVWTTVMLSRHVYVGSTLLVTAPATRRPFALASGAIVSDPPVVGVLGGIGLGITM